MPAYSGKAQAYLDAIASGVFSSVSVRNFLVAGTHHAETYRDSATLVEEQRAARWRNKATIQPFWANYWCGKDSQCECRIEGSKGLESDAIFFLENALGRRLAIHIEFKHDREAFGYGQAGSYPLRAECFARTHASRAALIPHDDWLTVLFCGDRTSGEAEAMLFQKVISHSQARSILPDWPSQ